MNTSNNSSSSGQSLEPKVNGIGNNNMEHSGLHSIAAGSCKRNVSPKLTAVETETYNDDEIDDEYCIYTYKGDTRAAADLPSNFFMFDQGDSLSSTEDNCTGACTASSGRRSGGFNGIDDCCPSTSTNVTTHHHVSNGSVVTISASASRANGIVLGQGRLLPAGDLFSPDMDFLEMDFDPGGFGDDDDDYQANVPNGSEAFESPNLQTAAQVIPSSGLHEETTPIEPLVSVGQSSRELDVTDGPNIVNAPLSPVAVASTNSSSSVSHRISESIVNSNLDQLSVCTTTLPRPPSPNCPKEVIPSVQAGLSHLNPQLLLGLSEPHSSTRIPSTRQLIMRLVKSSTLPEIRSQSNQDVSNHDGGNTEDSGASRITRNQCLSYSDPLIKNEPCYRAVINHAPKSATEDDNIEFEVGGVMIWSEQEACQRSLDQIGTSACGATAVCNVLKALGFDNIDPAYVNSCVKTRLRANNAEIPEYLFSRSVAGATYEDLIQGIVQVSNGLVNGRFFQPKPEIESGTFCKWLLHWICKGAVPVVTRNMQVLSSDRTQPGQQIPDAWHHQMIFGISPNKIFLTNPLERESPAGILPQLTSPSVLFVRRSDVIERKTPTTNLRKITRHPNPEWNELNVLGQVANILLEEIPVFSSNSIVKRIRTTHITIPAAYKGGVTLFMPTTSPFFPLLLQAPDL